MAPIRVVVVDDEPLAISRLVAGLSALPHVEVVGTARDGQSALDLIKATAPDVAFLDIKMPTLSGLDVATALAGSTPPAIIFVTAFGRFAIKAFELAAVDYLLKPVDLTRLHEALDRAMHRLRATQAEERASELQHLLEAVRSESLESLEKPRNDQVVWVRDRDSHVRIAPAAIEYLQAERDYVQVHTKGKRYLVREPLRTFVDKLQSAGFVRVHRSYVVNVDFVDRVLKRPTGATEIMMISGTTVPVGRNHAHSIRSLLAVLEKRGQKVPG